MVIYMYPFIKIIKHIIFLRVPPLLSAPLSDSSQVPPVEQLQPQMVASGLLVPSITSYPAQG